jgi:2,3-bisphosphoglycerate-independent phosphoglycerate mutase
MNKKPLLLVIMDGVGISEPGPHNAVSQAHLETYTNLLANYPSTTLLAAGQAVGIPDGDMGNSEVGHNAMGAGQIIAQGPLKVQTMFEDGSAFDTQTWHDLVTNVLDHDSTLHFIGIFSDGNVHANIYHLFAMMKRALEQGVKRIRVHPAIDGRDVPPETAEKYTEMFKSFVHELGDPDYKIADGIGRMVGWSDRYENDWGMVERGFQIALLGEGPHFTDPTEAVLAVRPTQDTPGDQYMKPFVIVDGADQPIGLIQKGDSVVYLDFRADRAIETAQAFTYNDFPHFARKYADGTDFHPDDIYFAGVAEYNADSHVPAHVLMPPLEITHTLSDTLSAAGISQYAVSETVKYGHVTYYFDGNHYLDPNDTLHTYVEVPSDTDTSGYVNRPWMKCAEITDTLIAAMKSGNYDFMRVNYPNGDMVGHFGDLESGIVSIEAVDLQLKRIMAAANETGATVIITADHGNVEEISDANGNAKTSHTTNPVPCIFYDPDNSIQKNYTISTDTDLGLSNLAATITTLLGLPADPAWRGSILVPKQ